MASKWWLFLVILLLDGFLGPKHLRTDAFTLDGYFKIIALASKKRDFWRKMFFGKDLGFQASPWLFKDRVHPPFVPIVKSFPKYPSGGHYWNERGPSSSHISFPQFYSNLRLAPRFPPPPVYARTKLGRQDFLGQGSKPGQQDLLGQGSNPRQQDLVSQGSIPAQQKYVGLRPIQSQQRPLGLESKLGHQRSVGTELNNGRSIHRSYPHVQIRERDRRQNRFYQGG